MKFLAINSYKQNLYWEHNHLLGNINLLQILSSKNKISPNYFCGDIQLLFQLIHPSAIPRRNNFIMIEDPRGWFISNFDTFTLHLSLAHISNPISETIHFSPLITTIKNNKIVSLLFNMGLTIFTNSSSSIFILISLHLCYNIYSF